MLGALSTALVLSLDGGANAATPDDGLVLSVANHVPATLLFLGGSHILIGLFTHGGIELVLALLAPLHELLASSGQLLVETPSPML